MGNITFRKARDTDLGAIGQIYDRIHTNEEKGLTSIGWRRDIYPTIQTARSALDRGDLYVGLENDKLVACAIINSEQHPGYAGGKWQYPANPDEVLVLHTLVVDPDCQGRGIGPEFVDFYEDLARGEKMRVLRMDTNIINAQARRLYARLGFREAGLITVNFHGLSEITLVLLEKQLN